MPKLQHIEENIDAKTGEVKTIRKTFSVKSKNTEEFYLTFLSGLNAICDLSRPSDIKILTALCAMAEFNTGKVKLTSHDRKDLIKRMNISAQSFSNSINRLKEASLLTGERGDYEVNPQCFWKGTTDERQRLLKERSADILLKYRTDEK